MDRRQFIQTGAATALAGSALAQAPKKAPNLVFLFSDQQSWDYLGAYGLSGVQTPNIDRMASQGALFNQCIANTPVCTPYRGMLLTGRHPLNNGAYANDLGVVPGQGATFAESLGSAGYDTAYIGKWHLQGGLRDRPVYKPKRLGFDQLFQTNNCTVDFHPGKCFYWTEDGKKSHFQNWEQEGQTDQAVDYLETRRDSPDPFALFVSWHAPHNHRGGVGYDAPQKHLDRYDQSKLDCRFHAKPSDRLKQVHHGYAALCSSIDECVGRIMDKLEAIGEADNTILVFTSDHGDTLGGYARQTHKCCPESAATRVPLVVRWPGHVKAGSTRELLVGTMDLMPSLLSLLGVSPPQECQGHNLAKAILSGDDEAVQSQPLFFFWWNWRGVYTREHTYSVGGFSSPTDKTRKHSGFDVLYANEPDPWNRKNLYESASHKATRQHLHKETLAWLDRFDDPFIDEHTLMSNTAGITDFRRLSRQPISEMTFKETPLATLKRLGVKRYRPAPA
jgi:arylsulfatase A-like enzyme